MVIASQRPLIAAASAKARWAITFPIEYPWPRSGVRFGFDSSGSRSSSMTGRRTSSLMSASEITAAMLDVTTTRRTVPEPSTLAIT